MEEPHGLVEFWFEGENGEVASVIRPNPNSIQITRGDPAYEVRISTTTDSFVVPVSSSIGRRYSAEQFRQLAERHLRRRKGFGG